MAVSKTFIDVDNSSDLEIQVMSNDTLDITIASTKGCESCTLDIPTAVALSKELKRLIAELKEQENE